MNAAKKALNVRADRLAIGIFVFNERETVFLDSLSFYIRYFQQHLRQIS